MCNGEMSHKVNMNRSARASREQGQTNIMNCRNLGFQVQMVGGSVLPKNELPDVSLLKFSLNSMANLVSTHVLIHSWLQWHRLSNLQAPRVLEFRGKV